MTTNSSPPTISTHPSPSFNGVFTPCVGAWVRVHRFSAPLASDTDWPPTRVPENYHGRITHLSHLGIVYLTDAHGQHRVVHADEIFRATERDTGLVAKPLVAVKAEPKEPKPVKVSRPRRRSVSRPTSKRLSDVPGLSLSQVAERAGVSPACVSKDWHLGRLHAVRHSHKCVRVSETECARYLAARGI